MGIRNEKRRFIDNEQKELVDLMGHLNYFCFHGSEADDNCCGCVFENEAVCPLNTFCEKLSECAINKIGSNDEKV